MYLAVWVDARVIAIDCVLQEVDVDVRVRNQFEGEHEHDREGDAEHRVDAEPYTLEEEGGEEEEVVEEEAEEESDYVDEYEHFDDEEAPKPVKFGGDPVKSIKPVERGGKGEKNDKGKGKRGKDKGDKSKDGKGNKGGKWGGKGVAGKGVVVPPPPAASLANKEKKMLPSRPKYAPPRHLLDKRPMSPVRSSGAASSRDEPEPRQLNQTLTSVVIKRGGWMSKCQRLVDLILRDEWEAAKVFATELSPENREKKKARIRNY